MTSRLRDRPRLRADRITVAVLTCLAACQGPSDVRTPIRTDSAGVEIVRWSHVPRVQSPDHQWTLRLIRSIRTVSDDPAAPPLLYDPRSLTRLPDGTIVVFDLAPAPLVVISPTSDSIVRAFGRVGQGPTEIYGGYPLLWPGGGSSFWVADRGNSRVTRFDLTGRVLDERPVRSPGTSLEWRPASAKLPVTAHLAFWGDEGRRDSVGVLDPGTGEIVPRYPLHREEARTATRAIWTPRGLWVPLGMGVLVTGRSSDGLFRVWGSRDELLRIIDMPLRQRALQEADLPRLADAMGGTRVTLSDFAESYPVTDILHAFGDSLFALRHTWVSHPEGDRVEEDVFKWRLVGWDGSYGGSITFPESFEPRWTDGRTVLGLRRDSLGVATIQEYRASPPRRQVSGR